MKKTMVLVGLALLCVSIVAFILLRSKATSTHGSSLAKKETTMRKDASFGDPTSNVVPEGQLPAYKVPKGFPYERAVSRMMAQHPELGITDAQAKELQALFSKHYKAFVDTRNKAVRSRELANGAIEVQVPAIPELGRLALADYMDDVRANPISSEQLLSNEMERLFRGYTENAGLNSVTYTLNPVDGSSTLFAYVRDVVMANAETGKPSGSGRTSGITDITTDTDPVLVAVVNEIKRNKP